MFAGTLEGGDFWSIKSAHNIVVCDHAEAVYTVFWEHDHVHVGVACPRFLDQVEDMIECVLELVGCANVEELRLAETDDDGV